MTKRGSSDHDVKISKKNMIAWTPISEREMVARFKSRYRKISVIQCFAPTNDAEEETKDIFYQQLHKAVDNVPSDDVQLVIGDLNAKVGRSNEGRGKIIGKNGLGYFHMHSKVNTRNNSQHSFNNCNLSLTMMFK